MKIKVITLNIWLGGKLWEEAVEFIRAESPDILLLQEVNNSHDASHDKRFRTIDELAALGLFSDHDFIAEVLDVQDFGKVERGNAVFSKFPIVERFPPVFFNQPFNDNYVDIFPNYSTVSHALQQVTVDVQGISLNVFNFQGVWDLDGTNDSPERLKMSQTIVDAVQDLDHVILAGDTNAQRNCQTIRNIEAHLTNIFGDELQTSFNLQQKDLDKFPGYATAVVDMMFASPNLKVVEHYCPQVNVSDHLPLVAVIEVPEK